MAHLAVDVVVQLDGDHAARQFQRMKTRAPITLVSTIVIVGSLVLATILFIIQPVVAIFVAVLGLLAAALWSLSARHDESRRRGRAGPGGQGRSFGSAEDTITAIELPCIHCGAHQAPGGTCDGHQHDRENG